MASLDPSASHWVFRACLRRSTPPTGHRLGKKIRMTTECKTHDQDGTLPVDHRPHGRSVGSHQGALKRSLSRTTAVLAVSASLGLGGCSTVVSGTLTLGDFSNVFGMVSTLSTGKGIEEHLLSWVMGKDCRIFDGVVRSDRKICEEKGSIGTDKDFKGVYVMMFGEELEPTPARLYAKDVNHKRLDELRPAEPTSAPSMARPKRRAAPAVGSGRSGFAARRSDQDRLASVLAATAPVIQDQTMMRTLQRPPQRPTGQDMPPRDDATDGTLILSAIDPGLMADHRPSLSRTVRKSAATPNAGVAAAQGTMPSGDSLDRLSALWWPADGSESVLSGGQSLSKPAGTRDPQVDYRNGGTAVELVFGAED